MSPFSRGIGDGTSMDIEIPRPKPSNAPSRWLAMQGAQSMMALANWPSYWMARFLGRGSSSLRFRQGFSFPKPTPNEAGTLLLLGAHGVKFSDAPDPVRLTWGLDSRDRIITTPTGIRFHLPSIDGLVLAETYLYDIHFCGADLHGKTVVDVGANVGDTALYFAERGAEVLAFEPDPMNFQGLLANLELNPSLRPRVHPFPFAVGTDGEVAFHVGLGGGSGMYESAGTVRSVKSVSLETLLKGRDRVYLLKSDCKGAEYELARQPAMRRFDHLAIEYYWISPGLPPGEAPLTLLLERVRELGFGRWRAFKHNSTPLPLSQHGILEADFDPAGLAPRPGSDGSTSERQGS